MSTSNEATNVTIDNDNKRYRLNKKAKSTNNESTQPLLLNENIQLPPLDENIQSLPLNEDDVDADSVGNSNSEEKDEPVKFSVIVNLERELVNEEIMSLEIDQNEDTEFREVINTLLLPLQAGSKYYWEFRNLYINKKNNQPTGEVPTIERYPCEAHEHPTYRETNLPKNAVEWMHQHLNPRLRKIEIYQQLCDENLINPSLHTYQQVYYWIHKFSTKLYITDVENQLKSSMNFFEQSELKMLAYTEFNFINSHWLPVEQMGKICPEELIKELLGIIKKHALMHPLISIEQTTFLTKEKIRSQCVFEIYQFCFQRNLNNL
ncbi:34403_t:CDS:2 [Gigaspora margarita]|uniref:34403_t:CDS:1 n=1 Tax=Gigaspora margarita TaxID=4874 RepID=A0ABM8VZT5_GIGMA|nr:34403_t:CDS:2 [Gigaspora margarita]